MSVWRAWQHECQDWQAERGIVRGAKGWRRQFGPGQPPTGWVCAEFALAVNEESTPCPSACHTHENQRIR
ncbi:hypothetical protein PV396_41970 [Streptomyces sp. ME02-8801-2C]|uniref:hypothetical protein n=1 Tax=Streptomyces sp. ME02-8801-2C TaxID=3028680 RepID=UPI0029B1F0A4|nr:hypothetical protein [Streptomyces sp. ME02-8801-2C]MDX3458433.1 hypothetical protein [Streptomyces sp. ME02-8801-2C]